MMDKVTNSVSDKISKLRNKQKVLEGSWRKTGNRSLLLLFVDIVPELLNAERCSIFIFNPAADSLWLYCGSEVEEGQIQVQRKGSLVGQTLSSGHPKITGNLEDKAGPHEIIDGQTGFTTCNALSVPIFNAAKDQVIGVFQVLNKRGIGRFTEDDAETMLRISGEISRYVESIFKHQEVAEILIKLKKKILGLENSLAKQGIQKRLNEEMLTSVDSQETNQRSGRLH